MNEKGDFTELEREVARALSELKELVRESDRRLGILRWGQKRRRSGPYADNVRPQPQPEKCEAAACSRSSPTTPLSFSPSADEDNSDNPPPPPSATKKANRHEEIVVEHLQKLERLSANNETLKRSVEKKRGELEKLRLVNRRLQEIKLEMEITGPSGCELTEVGSTIPLPQMAAPTATVIARGEQISAAVPMAEGVRMPLPDLNVAAEEAAEVPEQSVIITKAAICAQARKLRREKQREKKNKYYRSSRSPSHRETAAARKKRLRVQTGRDDDTS